MNTVSSWKVPTSLAQSILGGYTMVGQPGIATTGKRTIVAFTGERRGQPKLMWSEALGNGSWAAPRAINLPGRAGQQVQDFGDPVLVSESGSRVLGVWQQNTGGGDVVNFDLGWTLWTATGRRSATGTIAGELGVAPSTAPTPVVAAVGNGAAVAWIAGSNDTDPNQEAEPVWVARQTADGFTKPTNVFKGDAAGLSLAGGGGVLALAFDRFEPQQNAIPGVPAPAMVMRSIDGAPFTAPVRLAESADSPTVSVDSAGDTIAVFYKFAPQSGPEATPTVEIASQRGAFSGAQRLGPPTGAPSSGGGELTVTTTGGHSFITWVESAFDAETARVAGVLAAP
jgi:hypothetical protein